MRLAITALCLVGCQHVSELGDSPSIIAPDAPEVETMRVVAVEHEPPPPKPAVAPFDPLARVHGTTKRWFLALSPQQRHAVHRICRMRKANPCAGLLPGRKGIGELDES